eukprot:5129979-Prymnesium_polylepis.1
MRPSSVPRESSSSPAPGASDPMSPLGSSSRRGVMKPLCNLLKFSHSLSIKSIALHLSDVVGTWLGLGMWSGHGRAWRCGRVTSWPGGVVGSRPDVVGT